MRRGHPGTGGWRSENTRHFRPRSGGTPHFRPPRIFGLLDLPRFAPHGSRFEIPSFNTRLETNYNPEHHDRSKYRLINLPNNQRLERDQHGHRGNYPHNPRRHGDGANYSQSRSYHENVQSQPYLINSMGDVDHRQLMTPPRPREPYSLHRIPVWNQNENKRSYYDEGNQNKSFRPDVAESGNLPTSDYIGHRPPASDHYGGNSGSAIDNSNSFSRSVDDTVDLVRKRLLNRNEPQHHSGTQPNDQNQEHQETSIYDTSDYQSTQETPTRKRVQRQRQNVKNNCDKMKNKIVHQLFKMDKDKIHKLMDNPSSSTKFEYAISSLITESQNSLNRHLRSVAEKSLTTSTDFINNDNNTIYEDTFMKQMQCILDPQDTMFLEDIKPLVMQELSKVLQLDNYCEQPLENTDGQANYYASDGIQCENTDIDIYNEYPPYEENDPQNYEMQNPKMNTEKDYEPEPLFERRPDKVERSKSQERIFSMEQRRLSRMSADRSSTENPYSVPDVSSVREIEKYARRSIDRKAHDEPASSEPLPIFDSNVDHFSEDDDPFADLDKQYHVAVDPNFIQDYNVSPQPSITSNRSKSPPPVKQEIDTPVKSSNDIKKEIDTQLFNIAKSPLEIIISEASKTTPIKSIQLKQEPNITPEKKHDSQSPIKKPNDNKILSSNITQEKSSQEKNLDHRVGNSENNSSIMKSSSSGSSRKRSLDQRPSHRKEKRKKSESSLSEPSKQILNKNIIINVSDCAAKKNEKCAEANSSKSIFNLFFSKEEHGKGPTKDTNKTESTDKSYSDKYVKRKEQPNVSKDVKEGDVKRRHRSISSSHSIVSPKANNSTSSNSSSNQPLKSDKSETKNKLKHIDMFTEQTRKVSTHQSNRNTALPPKTPDKIPEDSKPKKPVVIKIKKNPIMARNLITSHTFLSKKTTCRFVQTDNKKFAVKATQTDLVAPEKSGPKSTDTFERMKEIDLEIQELLREKFKLYSSLESKDTNQNLGMTVLNMAPYDEDKEQAANLSESEDAIVADFTNIPVEELEQIALETVEDDAFETPNSKKNLRQKVMARERTTSRSPSLKKNRKKAKAPNISLIEQIITDDRPLEDIISLDDLECSPIKSKKKKATKQKPKKKNSKKKVKQTKPIYDAIIIPEGLHLKECCVVLNRDDIENFWRCKKDKSASVFMKQNDEPAVIVETIPVFSDTEIESMYTAPARLESIQETVVNDDSVNVNDIHFDMLDVSEDIVIGDVYDVKSNDKDVGERLDMTVSEEVILDNSQSSMEEAAQTEAVQPDSQCKMYDFSTDDNLRRDAYMVTSNPDAVLALECVENNNFLAACLDGNVYHYNGDGHLITTLRGYNQPVTCLNIVKEKYGTTVYTGSLDSRIRYYDLESGMEKGPECNVLSPIQSMDRAWDTVFVGTRTGFVLQFECKNNMLIPVSTVKFSEQSILALRAMKEGPRKVLLVAARSEDVTIKDAQTGLLLRTLSGPKMTVYSLLYEDGKVYCGTSSHQIHVFDYASSSHIATHEGGKGVVCLRTSGGLLFAGCYDGCVYVYREGEPRPLAQLRGPGIMLLSLAIVGSKIIAGYKDRGLHIWKIPLTILQEMIL